MFTATARFEPFEHLRVPYQVAPEGDPAVAGRLWPDDGGPEAPSLWWATAAPGDWFEGVFEVAGCRVAGRVRHDQPAVLPGLEDLDWRWSEDVTDATGRPVAGLWTTPRGDVFLPFDPSAVMRCLWSEGYRTLGSRARVLSQARRAAVRGYYGVRPMVPRQVQLTLRRRLAQQQSRPSSFPRWPLETGLHDLTAWLLETCGRLAGGPVPWIAPWPDGHRWCMVLTHDVETAQGCADIELLRGPERAAGYRSSWNFVPERYPTPTDAMAHLEEEGCEIGVHGLRHDGRDLASARMLHRRLPAIRAAAERWGASGFRSPATQRGWALMPMLGFDYDSSYTDTDPYEPQPGGCASFLPFFDDQLVELPITLPQDHTLFSILAHRDGGLWISKGHELRRRGGMLLVLSHPDYAHGPALDAWKALLTEFRDDPEVWQPLAREVAAWWRDRAHSTPVRTALGWTVRGPAAQRARVVETARRVREAS